MIKDAPGTVVTYLKALEKKGYIRRPKKKNQKRAVRVISPVETRRFEFPLQLRPAHTGMKSIRVKKGDLRIEGKVAGVMRYYK